MSQAVVVADAGNRGEKRLVAYVVAAGAGAIEPAVLKAYLSRRLPTFMIPSVIVPCDALPLSPNGKVDRSALPPVEPLEACDASPPEGPAPLSKLEQTIAGIWHQVLDRSIGPEDNFFDLGGDSLQLIEVHSELQKSLGRDRLDHGPVRVHDGPITGRSPREGSGAGAGARPGAGPGQPAAASDGTSKGNEGAARK